MLVINRHYKQYHMKKYWHYAFISRATTFYPTVSSKLRGIRVANVK